MGSLLQAPSWEDVATWLLRDFTYPPLSFTPTCEDEVSCSHSGCEFGGVLRVHNFHLRRGDMERNIIFVSSRHKVKGLWEHWEKGRRGQS